MSTNAYDSYYLVALPRGEVLEWATRFQQEIADRYGIYEKPYPPIHMTMGVLFPNKNSELQRAVSILHGVLGQRSPFSIQIEGSSCFAPPYKSLNLSVAHTPELLSVARDVYDHLHDQGIEAKNMHNWDFHISLVNTVFARREWSIEEFYEACYLLENRPIDLKCDIQKLQLWSPHFPPLSVAASFKLHKRSNDF